MFLVICQFVLGVATVGSTLNVYLRASHAALGYGVWGLLFWATIRSGGLPFLWKSKNSQYSEAFQVQSHESETLVDA